jgi:hypothetical protein
VTLDGHPLRGFRAWQVSPQNGKVLLETWSVDEPANSRENFKFLKHWYLPGDSGAMAQGRTWQEMFEKIAQVSGGQLEWVSNPIGDRSESGNYQSLWQRMGVSANGD